MPKPKTRARLRQHFKRRWWLRYPNVKMPPINWIEAQIVGATESARFRWRESNTRTHWAVLAQGVWVPVVYDKRLGCVVTCLTPNALCTAQGGMTDD